MSTLTPFVCHPSAYVTVASKWDNAHFEGPHAYQKLTQRRLPRRAVVSPRGGGLAETLIRAAVGDEVVWDHKSPGRVERQRERRGQVGGL